MDEDDVVVEVLDLDGRPLRDEEVVVEQRGHAFSFGTIGFDLVPVANGEAGPDAELWFELARE